MVLELGVILEREKRRKVVDGFWLLLQQERRIFSDIPLCELWLTRLAKL
jgi:hypothetical protein